MPNTPRVTTDHNVIRQWAEARRGKPAKVRDTRELLNFEPASSLKRGIAELPHWLAGQAPEDRLEQAPAELTARGLSA